MRTFSDVLFQYGFETEEAKLDVIRLLHLAGCFEIETLSQDFRSVGLITTAVSAAQRVVAEACAEESFNAKLILERLFISGFSSTTEWPEKIHNWLILATQREFFARKPGQERWQQETGQWMTMHKQAISDIVTRLGLGNEVKPQLTNYDAIVIFGSTGPEMERRLTHAQRLMDVSGVQAPTWYLLCGERPVDKVADGGEEYLLGVAAKFRIPLSELTETHLMQVAFEKTFSEARQPFDVVVIDTPKGALPRPTTLTTLQHLVRLTPGLHGDVLFVSSAPNIIAQGEETKTTLQDISPNTRPEIVGGSTSTQVPPNRFMGAFAGGLYAGYARVAQALGAEASTADLLTMRQAFSFAKQLEHRAQQQQAPSMAM